MNCEQHSYHSPMVSDVDVHHVWPKFAGGPDVPENRVTICPTGHRNVHELLREYMHAGAEPSWSIRQHYGPAERALAAEGWQRMTTLAF